MATSLRSCGLALSLFVVLFEVAGAAEVTREHVMEMLGAASEQRPADLAGKDLSRLDLTGVDFKRANLSGANLSATIMAGANLFGANLTGARLTGADLSGANLDVALLGDADLTKADLTRASLFGVLLTRATLVGANLSGARIIANLSNANLSEAGRHAKPADGAHARVSHERQFDRREPHGRKFGTGRALLRQPHEGRPDRCESLRSRRQRRKLGRRDLEGRARQD